MRGDAYMLERYARRAKNPDIIELEDTCESISWWVGRKLDWSQHAISRSELRDLPRPHVMPNSIIAIMPGELGAWHINVKIEGIPVDIIAKPSAVYGKIVAKVITAYFYSSKRTSRENKRVKKRTIREVSRSHKNRLPKKTPEITKNEDLS